MSAEQPHQPPRPVNAFTADPMKMLFENLRQWNEFALSVNPGDLVIQVRLADGSLFPDEVCMDTPAGGCRFCNAIMGGFVGAQEPSNALPAEAQEIVDCPDCQDAVLGRALDEAVPKCICPPEPDADCDPQCEHPECRS